MTQSEGGQMAPAEDLTPGRRWWLIVRGLLRAAVTAAALVALYCVLPLDRRSDASVVIELVIGIGLLVATIAWQVRAILRADYPAIRATQSLAPAGLYLAAEIARDSPGQAIAVWRAKKRFGKARTRDSAAGLEQLMVDANFAVAQEPPWSPWRDTFFGDAATVAGADDVRVPGHGQAAHGLSG